MATRNGIRVDNGPEFISKELDLWAWMHGVALDFSRPGKPTDNAFAESFNGQVPDRMSQRLLVPQPRRRGGSMRSLAEGLQ